MSQPINLVKELRILKASMVLTQLCFDKELTSQLPNWEEVEIKKTEFNGCLERLNELIPIIVAEKPDPALISQDIKESLDLVAANVKLVAELSKLKI